MNPLFECQPSVLKHEFSEKARQGGTSTTIGVYRVLAAFVLPDESHRSTAGKKVSERGIPAEERLPANLFCATFSEVESLLRNSAHVAKQQGKHS
jgi:hypothetical protein